MDYQAILRAMETLKKKGEGEPVTEPGTVMTDVGPENARSYSHILAGKEAATMAPTPASERYSAITPTASDKPQLPGEIQALSAQELQGLVNQLYGVKPGRRGSVSQDTPRPKLLALAADAMGMVVPQAPEPAPASVAPSGPASAPQALASPAPSPTSPPPPQTPPAVPPRHPLASPPAPVAQVAASPPPPPRAPGPSSYYPNIAPPPLAAAASSPHPPGATSAPNAPQDTRYRHILQPVVPPRGIALPETPPQASVRQETKHLTWDERRKRLEQSGKMLPRDEVATQMLTKRPSPRQMVRQSERQEQRERDLVARQQGVLGQQAEKNRGMVQSMGIEAPPIARKGEPEREKEQTSLVDAMKLLTEAVKKAKESERTVAEDVTGLSWQERLGRLQQTGGLLSEETVQKSTLKRKVSPRDVIIESEQQEQRRRNQTRDSRQGSVVRAADRVAGVAGQSTQKFVSRIAGKRTGAAAGRAVQGASRTILSQVTQRLGISAAAGVGGSAAGGAVGSAVGGLGLAAAANPIGILAISAAGAAAAMVKLPGATQRLGLAVVESQRHMEKYNASLASLYARMDYQKRVLDIEHAKATSGSTAALGDNVMRLREETQWMRESVTTIKNVVVSGMVNVGRLVNLMSELLPEVRAGRWLLQQIEKMFGQGDDPAIFRSYLRPMTQHNYARPRNQHPRDSRRPSEDS